VDAAEGKPAERRDTPAQRAVEAMTELRCTLEDMLGIGDRMTPIPRSGPRVVQSSRSAP